MGNSPGGPPEAREPVRIYFTECGYVRIETRHSRKSFTPSEFIEIVGRRLRHAAAAAGRGEDFSSPIIHPAEAPLLNVLSEAFSQMKGMGRYFERLLEEKRISGSAETMFDNSDSLVR